MVRRERERCRRRPPPLLLLSREDEMEFLPWDVSLLAVSRERWVGGVSRWGGEERRDVVC